ncbi:MAG: PAS domain-containing protein [Alphaproteobacteria bacterium]|nr:PAS domain-containing protein [Alphaproteobacteria bacterium]MBV9904212.1 PAS domain-containing protein [Alphaproteobacteria bacterium]
MHDTALQTALDALNRRLSASNWTFGCAPAGDFKQPELTAVHALWLATAAGRAMPARAELTARAMKAFLPNMTLIEQVRDENGAVRYRVRLHGSALARYSGDATGKFMEDLVAPSRLGGYLAIYDALIELAVPLRVVSNYQAPDIDYLTGETFLAPLAAPNGGAPFILSVTYAKPRTQPRQGLSFVRLTA